MIARANLEALWSRVAAIMPGAAFRPQVEEIRAIGEELTGLNLRTERDFLQVGNRSGSLAESVHEIAREARHIVEAMGEERIAEVSAAFETVLAHTDALRHRTVSGRLESILRGTETVAAAMEGVPPLVRGFGALGILAQIESARLCQAGTGFDELALEVGALGTQIGCQTEELLRAAGEIRAEVKRALGDVRTVEAGQLARLAAVSTTVSDGLRKLQDGRQSACNATGLLSAEYEGTCHRVSDLVAALQFQDITRQQIEHAREALEQAAGEDLPRRERRRRLAAVAGLAKAQLLATEASFRTSAERIVGDLRAIAADGARMAERGQRLAGLAAERKDSFFAVMKASMSEILSVLAACGAAEQERSTRLRSLEHVAVEVNGLAEGIQDVTIRMQRIALNAAVRAIQTGPPGAPLAAVADAIHKQAADSATIAETVARDAAVLSADVRELAAAAQPASAAQEAPPDLRRAIETLHAADDAAFARVRAVGAMAARLAADLEEALAGFGDQKSFCASIEQCTARLASLAQTAGAAQENRGHHALEAVRAQYTMESERHVHDAVMPDGSGGNPPPGEPGAEAPVPAGVSSTDLEGDLGDNVELF